MGAIWILLVSIGASVSIHYCNGNVIDFAFDKRAEACKGYYQAVETNSHYCSFAKKGCCEDTNWLFVVENDYPPSESSEIPVAIEIAPFTVQYASNFVNHDVSEVYCFANAPPLIENDYQVLFQVFLI